MNTVSIKYVEVLSVGIDIYGERKMFANKFKYLVAKYFLED